MGKKKKKTVLSMISSVKYVVNTYYFVVICQNMQLLYIKHIDICNKMYCPIFQKTVRLWGKKM